MTFRVCGALTGAVALAGFMACAPITENARNVRSAPAALALHDPGQRIDTPGSAPVSEAQGYNPRTDPFAADGRIRGIASAIFTAAPGTPARIQLLFDMLRVGGRENVRLDMAAGRPRTAAEALRAGGDCSDLANLVSAVIKELNRLGAAIDAGALVMHSDSAPAGESHVVAFAKIGGKRIIIDLQAGRLGETLSSTYSITIEYDSLERAAAAYHREYGDFLLDSKDYPGAIAAYSHAAEIFSSDAYVYRNLAVAQSGAGDSASALRNHIRAHALEPSLYSQEEWSAIEIGEESRLASEAFGRNDWSGALAHYRRVLDLLGQLPQSGLRDEHMRRARDAINACEHNLGAAGGSEKK